MSQQDIKVIFIGGCGRSGSTLLDRMLGQMRGFVSAGELTHIWENSFRQNQLCGCGRPFRECKFWGTVIQEAFGGYDQVDFERIQAIKHSVERIRYIPRLRFSGFRSSEYQRLLSEYGEILIRLYRAIRDVSEATYIVDSSKEPPYGFVLGAVSKIELDVVHIVRDSRAVAYSWQRKKHRPEIHWKEEYMPEYGLIKSAKAWVRGNILAHLLATTAARYVLVRYEDIASQPRRTLRNLLDNLGIQEPNLGFIDGRTKKLKADHTVSGNPIRFTHGVIEVRPDLEWRHRMPASQRAIALVLTWPLLLKYGYLGG